MNKAEKTPLIETTQRSISKFPKLKKGDSSGSKQHLKGRKQSILKVSKGKKSANEMKVKKKVTISKMAKKNKRLKKKLRKIKKIKKKKGVSIS